MPLSESPTLSPELAACGEVATARDRHASHYLAFVSGSAPSALQQQGWPMASQLTADGLAWLFGGVVLGAYTEVS